MKYYFLFIVHLMLYNCENEKPINSSKNINSIKTLSMQTSPFDSSTLSSTLIYSFDMKNYNNGQFRELLNFIKQKDQEERLKFHKVYLQKGWVEASKAYNFEKNDSLCAYLFSELNNKVGFPDTLRFGKEADSVVFLVLAHASHYYRRSYIKAWEKSVRAKTSRADLFADIKDRVNIVDEGCQLYATQKVLREKDSCFLTICDLAKLNKRRKAIGLLPMNLKKIKQSRY